MDNTRQELLETLDQDADAALESLSLWQYGPVEVLWAALEASFRTLLLFSLEHDQDTPEYREFRRRVTDPLDIVFSRCVRRQNGQWRIPKALPLDAAKEAQPTLQSYSELRWFLPHAFRGRVSCATDGSLVSIRFVDEFACRRRARMTAAESAAVEHATRGSRFDDLWSRCCGGMREALACDAMLANESTYPIYSGLPRDLVELTRELGESTLPASDYLDEIARANGTTLEDLRRVVGWLVSWSVLTWHAYRDSVRRAVTGGQANPPSCPGVRLVKRTDFVARAVLEAGVPEQAALFFADICTTTPKAGHILAQPLVGFEADGADWLLLSPSLIQSSWFQLSLPAAAEKAGRVPGHVRDTKKAFAEEVASLLRSTGWLAGTDFEYEHLGQNGEIDLLCVHPCTGEAVVIECKDLMPIHSPATLRSADGEADPTKPGSRPTNLTKGIQQALDGTEFVRAEWRTACALAGLPSTQPRPARVGPLVVARWNIGSHALDDRQAPVVVLAQLAEGLRTSPSSLWDWLNDGAGANLGAMRVEEEAIALGGYTYVIPKVFLPSRHNCPPDRLAASAAWSCPPPSRYSTPPRRTVLR